MARPKTYSVKLTDDNVSQLKTLLRKKSTNDTVANRCRILLDLDEAHPPVLKHADCAKSHGISIATVANIVRLFDVGGIDSVITLKRSVNSDQARRKVDGRKEALIIATACGPAPEGHARWTIRLLEDHMKVLLETPVSREAIRRTLKKLALTNEGEQYDSGRNNSASPSRRSGDNAESNSPDRRTTLPRDGSTVNSGAEINFSIGGHTRAAFALKV